MIGHELKCYINVLHECIEFKEIELNSHPPNTWMHSQQNIHFLNEIPFSHTKWGLNIYKLLNKKLLCLVK
jgi:hypothetical protein